MHSVVGLSGSIDLTDVSRGLTTLVGRVQSIRNPDRPGSRGVFFGPLVFVISA
jgi:hypothetical protein